jgi:hypothetical protein
MSWSQEGSLALAALSALNKNHHRRPWIKGRVIPFTLDLTKDEDVQQVMDNAA